MEGDPAPPVPAQPIAYLDEVEASRPWVRFVRIVAAVGVVASSTSLAQSLLALMPLMGLPSLMPASVGFTVPRLLAVVPAGLLLAGSIACLSLRPVGHRLMVYYALTALVMTVVQIAFTTSDMMGRGLLSGTRGGYVLYVILSAGTSSAFPLTVLALMRQPPVARIFQGR